MPTGLKAFLTQKILDMAIRKRLLAHIVEADRNLALLKHYASLPHRDTGTYLKLTHGTGRVIVAPKEMPPGNYVMRVRVGVVEGTGFGWAHLGGSSEVGHPRSASN